MGLAYTLAKGEGWTGWSPEVLEADPTGALNKLRFWGPTDNDRTHNLTVNYSYMIPNATPDTPIVKWLLGDWQVSGVTKYLSGTATQPNCTSNNAGIATPTRRSRLVHTAACVFTGEPVFEVTRDPNLAEEDQLHFNPRAFAMATPLSATVGNFGDVPRGIFRHPGWWNWDMTLRAPLPGTAAGRMARRCASSCRSTTSSTWCSSPIWTRNLHSRTTRTCPGVDNLLQTSTTTGRYTSTNNNIGTTPPRQIGLTLRLDF